RILEIGAGTGIVSKEITHYLNHSNTYFVTDKCEDMLKLAWRKLKNFKYIKFKKMEGENLRFNNNSFDLVFMAGVLHHVNDPKAVILEALRVLKPGGKLIIDDLVDDKSILFKIHKIIDRGNTYFTINEWKNFISTDNFYVTKDIFLKRIWIVKSK
ncbi:MAG: class I SAM-dependent methyltransferase, partial [Candidatus Aenigmatarchaeota archaeon]